MYFYNLLKPEVVLKVKILPEVFLNDPVCCLCAMFVWCDCLCLFVLECFSKIHVRSRFVRINRKITCSCEGSTKFWCERYSKEICHVKGYSGHSDVDDIVMMVI